MNMNDLEDKKISDLTVKELKEIIRYECEHRVSIIIDSDNEWFESYISERVKKVFQREINNV